MGSSAASLAAFKVSVGGGGAALFVFEFVGVHGEAHGTSGKAPLGTGGFEDLVEALFFGFFADFFGAGNDEDAYAVGDLFAVHDAGGFAEVFDSAVGAATDEDSVDADVGDAGAGFESHVVESGLNVVWVVDIGAVEFGDGAVDADDHAGAGAPADDGFHLFDVDGDGFVEDGVLVGVEGFPVIESGFEFGAFGSKGSVFGGDVVEGGLVGGDEAAACAAFDGHITDGEASFHGELFDGTSTKFEGTAGSACGTNSADEFKDEVFGGDAEGEVTCEFDAVLHGFLLAECLGGEDVFNFGGADAEGDGTEAAVGGGVGVAADDGGAGQCDALFGADDVYDALFFGVHAIEADAVFGAVAFEGVDLCSGDGVGNLGATVGGYVVIGGGEGEFGVAHRTVVEFESFEGLWTGYFVDEVAVDVE